MKSKLIKTVSATAIFLSALSFIYVAFCCFGPSYYVSWLLVDKSFADNRERREPYWPEADRLCAERMPASKDYYALANCSEDYITKKYGR